jgi:uncharacterized protein YceK
MVQLKTALVAISISLLSGCALVDSFLMAKYDTNEYAAITQVRTQAEIAQATCEMYTSATYFKNFAQLRTRNEDTSNIAYNLYLIVEQLKKHYEKNETVSVAYCKMKMQQVEKNAISSQKIIGAKPR